MTAATTAPSQAGASGDDHGPRKSPAGAALSTGVAVGAVLAALFPTAVAGLGAATLTALAVGQAVRDLRQRRRREGPREVCAPGVGCVEA